MEWRRSQAKGIYRSWVIDPASEIDGRKNNRDCENPQVSKRPRNEMNRISTSKCCHAGARSSVCSENIHNDCQKFSTKLHARNSTFQILTPRTPNIPDFVIHRYSLICHQINLQTLKLDATPIIHSLCSPINFWITDHLKSQISPFSRFRNWPYIPHQINLQTLKSNPIAHSLYSPIDPMEIAL